MSAQHIRLRKGMVEPFCERTVLDGMSYGLSAAGYDVRVRERVALAPGGFMLASTLERFDIPPDILAKVSDKSSLARRGIAVQNTIIEPGWRGYLTLEITNHGNKTVILAPGSPIAQIIFHMLSEPTESPYSGKYQDQPDRPVESLSE